MDQEEHHILERLLKLTEDNNRILRKMERAARWDMVFRVIYWTFVIGAAIGLYYYVQPYVDGLLSIYTGLSDII